MLVQSAQLLLRGPALVSSSIQSGHVCRVRYLSDIRGQSQMRCTDEWQQCNITAENDVDGPKEEEDCEEAGDFVINNEEQHDLNDRRWVGDLVTRTKESAHNLLHVILNQNLTHPQHQLEPLQFFCRGIGSSRITSCR